MDGERFDRLTRALSAGCRAGVRCGRSRSLVAVAVAAAKPGAAGADDCKRAKQAVQKAQAVVSALCVPRDRTLSCAAPANCDNRNGCTIDLCGVFARDPSTLNLDPRVFMPELSALPPRCGAPVCAPGATCSHELPGAPRLLPDVRESPVPVAT